MEDTFGRNIRYLRLSVTELCDLRCRYCMAEEGICKRGHEELCSFEELRDFTTAAAALGVTKLRVTGGEPLVRRGIVELCAMLRAVPGIEELCLTTNGTRLEQLAAPLKAAGVDRLNISLDTLRPERYREITRTGKLENALRGIEAAERAGFENIKLNNCAERAYTLYCAAKDLTLGTKHLTVSDLSDANLVPPMLFRTICNAMAIRRFGLAAEKEICHD